MLYLIITIVFVILISIRQVNQYERGVRFTLGKYAGIVNPGWTIVLPIFQSMHKVDIRVKAVDVPTQLAITRDNVSANINAVIYYQVSAAEKAVLEVQNFYYAVSQLAQTTMRNVVGEVTLDELLAERNKISERIKEIVEKTTSTWGLKVSNVELKDISLPEEMKRVIAKQAEAERERRAVITKAEGDAMAADNLAKAAKKLAESPGALHLRTLSTLNDLSSDQSNTVIFAVPLEVLEAVKGFGQYFQNISDKNAKM